MGDGLRDLVLFVQLQKREKHPWRSDIFSKVAGFSFSLQLQASDCNFTKSNTSPWVFFTFFKLHKWYLIVQSVSYYVFIQRKQSGTAQRGSFLKKQKEILCEKILCELSFIKWILEQGSSKRFANIFSNTSLGM